MSEDTCVFYMNYIKVYAILLEYFIQIEENETASLSFPIPTLFRLHIILGYLK